MEPMLIRMESFKSTGSHLEILDRLLVLLTDLYAYCAADVALHYNAIVMTKHFFIL